jgi:hypothetical protein
MKSFDIRRPTKVFKIQFQQKNFTNTILKSA